MAGAPVAFAAPLLARAIDSGIFSHSFPQKTRERMGTVAYFLGGNRKGAK
jgi:hypothetical protein